MELSEEEQKTYVNMEMPVSIKQSASWAGNKKIKAKASVRNMTLFLEFDLSGLSYNMAPKTQQDTFPRTSFNLSFTSNNQPLKVEMNPQKHGWFYRNGIGTKETGLLDQTSDNKELGIARTIEVSVPLFAFAKYPANQKVFIDVHLWQDFFITRDKPGKMIQNGVEYPTFTSDTLKTKLIDNVYSFALTVPEIYKSDIVCDSIVLQDDANWSPYGSDNTIWKSSLPDIYFAIHDMNGLIQGSSNVEKSTAVYTIGDTIPYYHYREKERFSICVSDWDMLSKNDVLGYWNGYTTRFTNNKNYALKFDHVQKFCFRRKYYGKIN